MTRYLDSISVTLKDLGDQPTGRYAVFTPLGIFYTSDIGKYDEGGMRRFTLPNGDTILVQGAECSVVPISMLEFATGAERVKLQHDDQHAIAEYQKTLHPEDPVKLMPVPGGIIPVPGYR